jgi:hypothetical protein
MRNMLCPAASHIAQEEHIVFDSSTVGECRSMVDEM